MACFMEDWQKMIVTADCLVNTYKYFVCQASVSNLSVLPISSIAEEFIAYVSY